MSAAAKSIVIGILGLLLAVMLGTQLGKGSWVGPLLLAAFCVAIAVYILFFRTVRLEALVLGFLLFGYIVGNRGFAQLSLGQNTPIYVGELGMLICLAMLGIRLALSRERPIPNTPLSWAIVLFLIYGGIRLYFDTMLHVNIAPVTVAIRDSATVYYAVFFFIAYRLGRNAVSRKVLERCILVGCIVLLPVFLIQFFIAPELFSRISFHGYPLISHKGDLTTTYLAFSTFYFLLRSLQGPPRILFRMLSLFFFAGMLMLTARAALFGFGCAALLLLVARRFQFVLYQLALGGAFFIVITTLHVVQLDTGTGFVGKVSDRVESMIDLTGSHTYRSTIGETSFDNNQFRLVWWRNVISETMDKQPWFGLGFGYDLTRGFLREYYLNMADTDVRSPHSIWVTTFGRTGAVGVILFFAITCLLLREALRTARKIVRRRADQSQLAHWCAVIVLLGSASFGVVLEGPMGGILFWTFLGLASSQRAAETKREAEPPAEEETKSRRSEHALISVER